MKLFEWIYFLLLLIGYTHQRNLLLMFSSLCLSKISSFRLVFTLIFYLMIQEKKVHLNLFNDSYIQRVLKWYENILKIVGKERKKKICSGFLRSSSFDFSLASKFQSIYIHIQAIINKHCFVSKILICTFHLKKIYSSIGGLPSYFPSFMFVEFMAHQQ